MNVSKKELQVRLFRVTAIIRTMDPLQRQPAEFTDNWTESNDGRMGWAVGSLTRSLLKDCRKGQRGGWRTDGTFQNEFDASNVKML